MSDHPGSFAFCRIDRVKAHSRTIVTAVLCVLPLKILIAPAFAAPVITEATYELADLSEAELLNDWTAHGAGVRSGIAITCSGNARYYTRSDIDLGNGEAFLIEASMSAVVAGGAGERGARLRVRFYDDDAPFIPPPPERKLRFIELRLHDDGAGSRRAQLIDGIDGSEEASIPLEWAGTAPRNVIRVRRQLIGGESFLFLEATNSSGGFESVAVSLSLFGADIGTESELGFGNFVPGTYTSEWETVRVIRSNEPDTFLPPPLMFVPALPPTGSLVLVMALGATARLLLRARRPTRRYGGLAADCGSSTRGRIVDIRGIQYLRARTPPAAERSSVGRTRSNGSS